MKRLWVLLILMIFIISCASPQAQIPKTTSAPPVSVPPASSAVTPIAPTVSQTNAPTNIRDAGNKVEYLDSAPISISSQKGSVSSGVVKVPIITWGGDVATIYANGGLTTQSNSIFAKEGLSVSLFRQDNFQEGVEKLVRGDTPYLRGSFDMIYSSLEALQNKGIDMVVIYQLTWSTGGDTIVVRSDQIKTPADLKGKQIGVQKFGPHMLYLATVLKDSGINLSDVKIKWLRELSIPSYDSKGIAVDPMSAMQKDTSLSAVTVISPDMTALTSGGGIGTGAESSVKGAKLLLSTKTAGQIISDVYAVRKDYFDSNKQSVQAFVHGLLLAQESTVDLFNNRDSRKGEYQQLLKTSASILRDSPDATADVEGLLMDATFVGYRGNLQFFTGQGTLRSFDNLVRESQEALISYGFLTRKMALAQANWDWASLANGLKDAVGVVTTQSIAPKFDQTKVERYVQTQTAVAKSGTLFNFEIFFEPNQKDFSADTYRSYFDKVLDLSSKYPGAIILVEGHADPKNYNDAVADKKPQMITDQIKQSTKNLSLGRANAVRDSIINYAKGQSLTIDPSQFTVMGAGIDNPKFANPKTESEWRQNMNVSFQIIQVEAELGSFQGAK